MKKINSRSSQKPRWQIHEAKSRFDELFELARTEGPQTVTRKGKKAVVIIAAEEYERLTAGKRSQSLIEFFARSPLAKANLDLERIPDYGREVELFSTRISAGRRGRMVTQRGSAG